MESSDKVNRSDGRAASVTSADATDRPRRSVWSFGNQMMNPHWVRDSLRSPMFKGGVVLQALTGGALALLYGALISGRFDVVGIAFGTGIDKPSPTLDFLKSVVVALCWMFCCGFVLYGLAVWMALKGRCDAPK